MNQRFVTLLAAGITLMLILAGCNGNDNDDNNGDDAVAQLEMGDIFYDPTELSGPAGGDLVIEIDNTGAMIHTFTIEEGAARGDGFDEWPGDYVDHEFDAGESDSITLTLPDEAGEYEFFCRIPGHYEAGQRGTLTVN